MPSTLEQRLAKTRRQIRRLLWMSGLSWLVAVVLGAALFAGLLDWFWHLDDAGIRAILALSIVAAAGWIGWRKLVAPLSGAFSDVDLALQIEKRFPGFRDSLASTVQFAHEQANPRLGSPALQQRVIVETMQRVERVDIDDLFETRDVRKVGAVAAAIVLVVCAILGFKTAEAATAISRLVFPFSDTAWPKTTELQIVDSSWRPLEPVEASQTRIAAGKKFELYVENLKGPLPDDAVLEYRMNDEELAAERLRRAELVDTAGQSRDIGVAALSAQSGTLWFRAIGGDDREMPWRAVEVVQPPVIEKLQVALMPPAYSGHPATKLPLGVGHVQGLVGTRVDVEAWCSKELASLEAHCDGKLLSIDRSADDAKHFRASFVIDKPDAASYWFDLTDEQGFTNEDGPRYEIRPIADQVPVVEIEEPVSDITATSAAVVPLKVAAKDDLALKSLQLHGEFDESTGRPAFQIPLFVGDDRPQQQSVEFAWQLETLSLKEGTRIAFHAEAVDYYDLGPPHVGRSLSRTLTIVSPREKLAEFDVRQGDLVGELQQIEQMQGHARDQVAELLLQLEKVGALKPADVDLLKRVALDQRQISARLYDPVDGIERRVGSILRELENNALDAEAADTKKRLDQIADELAAVREENLPQIERALTQARKGSEQAADSKRGDRGGEKNVPSDKEPTEPKADQPASLSAARRQQEIVLESLQAMLQQLSRWQNRRDLSSDVGELIAGQKQLNRETEELGRKTLTKSAADLKPQERADLAKLGRRQRQQADRLSQVFDKLGEAIDQSAQGQGDEAGSLRDAREHLQKQGTAGRMRESADQLERNEVGRASAGQQQSLDDLAEVRDLLERRGVSDSEELVKQLKESEAQLDKLHQQQDEIHKKSRDSENANQNERQQELKRLAKQQQQLREQTESLARRLRRLQARDSSESSARAASQMNEAQEGLESGDAEAATSEQQQALEDLEQAGRELAKERQQAEERLAFEMLEKTADILRTMIVREQAVIDETTRLSEAYKARGNWSRGQLKSVAQLADTQLQLKQETDRLSETLKSAEVFAMALRGAARHMQVAAQRIANRQTDADTIAAETRAKQRFLDLIAALKQDDAGKPGGQAGGAEAGDGSGTPPSDGVPQLAQLKMLKTLQEDLQRRTEELDKARRAGELSAAGQAELNAVADEQGMLADMARSLMQAVTETFEVEDGKNGSKEDQ